ncbi:MAG: phospholipase D-like domain-containing protein, partial [Paracoccaceae bacterium]
MALPSPSLKIITALSTLLVIAACTSVPFDAPRSVTSADEVPKSGSIYQTAQEVEHANGGLNSIAPLSSGNDALGVRLRMIEQAEHALDLQYFLIKPDSAAVLISAKLLEAADRGVRIRFLLDDVFTTVKDSELAQLDSHPNIEIRIFNPLSRNTAGFMNYLLDFSRVNRRMHNKSIVVDNAMAVIGGRNIADEYFQIGTDTIFADFEMFIIGPAVQDISATFDLFWNDEYAVPIRALYTREVEATPDASELAIAVVDGHSVPDIYQHAINSTYLNDISAGRITMHRA